MENRVDIKNFVNSIEDSYPVDKWEINGIKIWPILRLRLHFFLINFLEKKENKVNTYNNKKNIKSLIKGILYFSKYLLFLVKLKKSKNIFVASNDHRLNYKNSRYNRFFDSFIELNNIHEYKYLEYGYTEQKNQYKQENIYFIRKYLKGFKFFKINNKTSIVNLELFDDFEKFLFNIDFTKTFLIKNNKSSFVSWFESEFYLNFLFYAKVLKRIKPQKAYILCYYGEEIMAFTAAANQLSIKTIEYQHGPQVDVHLAYGSWKKVPQKGYDILPRNFYCWDSFSANSIKTWTDLNSLYKVNIVGNTWVNYWKNIDSKYPFQNFILYCIQPFPFTLEQLFNENIMNFIKTKPFVWFIRLHPRQIKDKKLIENYLKVKGIFEKVNIDNATNDQLPILLSHAKIHVTHYSGSTLEAMSFGLKTILLNEIGNQCFSQIIYENKAIYINSHDVLFENKFNTVISESKV